MASKDKVVILMADDDEDDLLMTRDAFDLSRLNNQFLFVKDGVELLKYLRNQGDYSDPSTSPRPGIILLDLNMPLMDGREALKEIKSDPKLRSIPIIVLTTSKADEDIIKSYDLGVNSFITKPVTFQGLAEVIKQTAIYWFEIVQLPDIVNS